MRWSWHGVNNDNKFSQELEPENIVINGDDTMAYMVLQVCVLDDPRHYPFMELKVHISVPSILYDK